MTLRRLTLATAILAYFTGVAFAAADPPPAPDPDAAVWIKAIYTAVTSKNWGLVVGMALIALVYPLRKYGPGFVKGKTGGLLLAFATSLAGTFGAALLAGARPDLPMIITALTTAATGAGLWAWLKDHISGVQNAATKIAEQSPVRSQSYPASGSLVALCVVALGAGLQPSCASAPAVTGGAIVVDCLKEDQTQLIGLVGSLWSVFANGGSWNDVKDSAIGAGKTLGGCALAEMVQKYLAPPRGRAAPAPEQGRAARRALEEFRTEQADGATFKTAAGHL